MKRLIVTAVTGVAMAFTAVNAPAATAAPPGAITWGPCDVPWLVAAGAQCGMLDVPMDYRRPDGKRIQLAVSRVRHTSPDSAFQGVITTLPGGPGQSGLGMSALGPLLPGHAGDTYDWIGFAPRGVGTSKPALTCDPGYMDYDRPSYVPSTPQLEQAWLGRVRGYAAACAARNDPDLLANMKTTDTVADLESLRVALGVSTMSFYGYSYGTYVGQVYATLHPERVRRMVLDSNVAARDVYYRLNLDESPGFDRNLNLFLGWVASHDDVYHLGRTLAAVQAVFDAQLAKLARHPAAGMVGPDEWLDIFQQASYGQPNWTLLGSVFAGWVNAGDGETLKALFEEVGGRGDDNAYAAYLAVECTDTQSPVNWNKWRADTWQAFPKAPYFAWQNTWYNAPCAFWGTGAGKPVDVGSRGLGSLLLIDETLDAATPYEGSLETRGRFPNSALIAVPGGTSHANTLRGNACVDDKIAKYLTDGTLPARQPGKRSDVDCAPLPLPDPGAS
ncbi:alpha/beta hydrolase [Amycolatopsis australiensis]|uniref:TAP-like protein n=1 Tax=Amycolatopsis australiensis TaxID=546364 RepID=A0A1K1RLF7_9PSEU|nr:alpha/beta hydrolase [Amycolatopsis australiensis]SFW72534.1 TAP-like protein [Amycolatopsis australiensis]